MAVCEIAIDGLPVLTSCPDDNELVLFFGSPTSQGMALRRWSTVKQCIACDFFGPGAIVASGSLFDVQGRYFNSALPNSVLVFYNGQPNFLVPVIQWTYITDAGGNVIGIRIDPNQMPIDPSGYVFIIPNPVGCQGVTPSPQPIQSIYNYELDAPFIVPNVSPLGDGQVITITINAHDFNYTWDTLFEFNDTYPEQPTAKDDGFLQVYEFTYFIAAGKWVCTDQALNTQI